MRIQPMLARLQPWHVVVFFASVLALFLTAFTALLPWRTRPPDEIAVAVAAPIIAVISSVMILVYVLDTILFVVILRIAKETGTRVGDVFQVPPIEFRGTFSLQAVFLTFLFATFGLAFLIMVALLNATGIVWALPHMRLMTVSVFVITGLAFLYGWVRGVLDRQTSDQPRLLRMVFLAYRVLWSLGMARGVGRA